jgi:hypothetical protein
VYNLETDQGEEHDVAAERADVVKVLAGIMDAVHVPSPDWVPKKPGGEKSKAQPAPAAAN